ncbi:MAG: mechanosensitive ion channel, partial [Planctomycetia bacterium]
LLEKTEEVANYISERVLWVRSTEILGPSGIHEAGKGLVDIAQPKPWVELSKRCGLGAMQRKWSIILLAVAMLVILLAIQKHLNHRIRNLCVEGPGSASLKIWPTIEGILLTATVTAPLPLLLAFAGWWIMDADGASTLSRSIGWGLHYVAVPLWVAKFTRWLCRPGLVAETHFGWSNYSLAIVRRNLRWLSHSALPLIFLIVFTNYYREGMWENSLGRIAFIGSMLLLAGFMHSVFFAKNNVLREILARNPDFWLTRFWFLFYLFAIGLPISLAALAWIGYYYSAQQLALRLAGTLALVLSLVLLHAVVSRWFLVKRRNLSLAQAKERLAREAENAENEQEFTPPPVIPVIQEQQQNLSEIHEHLNYLLRHAVAVCFLVGCWMIWSDVFPALNVLDKYQLWSSTVDVVETHKDATTGNMISQTVPTVVPTTARHLLVAILILFATFVIGRRLPALLEITLLSRIPFDKGGRHAMSILLRYLVALIGVVLACRTLSITWSSIQWLAAGITVGLGFGLQEIFANFISGLILLFERPIRVGDVITLGDTTGTVTDIRIRTTTVTNWDRKELIVPNKELITGRLLNWTLSDPVNRIVITVGVAYKTNTRKVRDLILEIAGEHPNVLEHPSPKVTFESFGDSALIFVLRCYIASMDIRLDTIHELHEIIHDRFNEEEIEIAFPQMDLHVRSVEQPFPKP